MIQTHNLNFSFGKRQILFEVNLEVPTGSIFGFLGPNGAGKTTTIKTILGLLKVEHGMARIFRKDIRTDRILILEKTGSMIEGPSLYDHLSGLQNIELTRKLRGISKTRSQEVIEIVGLTNDSKRPVRQYSTGMKQRLSLAIALLSNPKLLILDEPINGLDPGGIIEIRNLLLNLNQEHGCTIFLSSHILSEIEKLCTHTAVINKGRILYQGTMAQLLTKREGPERAQIEINLADRERAVEALKSKGINIHLIKTAEYDLEESFLDLINQ